MGALKTIGRIKKMHPELRLGQILVNAMPGRNLFYVSDETLDESLKAFEEICKNTMRGDMDDRIPDDHKQ